MTSIDTPSRGRGLGMGLAVVLAWLLGLAITLPAEWDRVRTGLSEQQGLAAWFADIIIDSTPYFLVLAVSPLLVLVVWLVSDGKRSGRRQVGWRRWLAAGPGDGGRGALAVAVFVGGLSILASAHVASRHPPAAPTVCFGELPPAYHDEYSYLFQARTLIDGRLSYPSHPRLPRLFDQMHVLNEGRFASRYFPGVGAWIAPFLAIGHPSQGHWLAGAIAAMAIFGAGRELAGNGTGLLAGVLAATSPGMAVFSNLLLSHHPTLAGLSVFLYLFLVMQRNGCAGCAAASGVGLALAMLCRPLTAAAVALP
ncbi:MAG TPA: hypothetical protein EYO87_02400, partial [Paracoccus sp.]|nr:hypothetical protein [Paracoccus sp. (in: a-proteobacteria)]